MKRQLFLSLLACGVLVYAFDAFGQEVRPAFAEIEAYYAVKPFTGIYGTYKAGEFVTDNFSVFGPSVEESGNYFEFSWEPEYDDEELIVKTVPKSQIDVRRYSPGWLAVAEVEKDLFFESKSGGLIRIFRGYGNGYMLADEDFDEAIVMSVAQYNKKTRSYSFSHYFFTEADGYVCLYDPTESLAENGCIKPLATSYYIAPYARKNAGKDVFDRGGNLRMSMEIRDMPSSDVVAYLPAENAIYYCGTLFYRK